MTNDLLSCHKLTRMKQLISLLSSIFIIVHSTPLVRADDLERQSNYTTAEIWIQHSDKIPAEKLRITDQQTVTELATHFPGILGDRGTGPRSPAGRKGTITVLFHTQSKDAGQMRVAHLSADLTSWHWRDNPPFTGERSVEGVDNLRKLLDSLASKNTNSHRPQ